MKTGRGLANPIPREAVLPGNKINNRITKPGYILGGVYSQKVRRLALIYANRCWFISNCSPLFSIFSREENYRERLHRLLSG